MATKKEKDQKLIIFGLLLLAAIGFVLAGIALGFSFNLNRFSLFRPSFKTTLVPPPTPSRAVFSLDPSTATKLRGEKLKVALLLQGVQEDISGIAVRINCYWGEVSTPIQFIDANLNQPGVQLEVNQELINVGWQYPVNQIIAKESAVVIDLAAVYISPEGFRFEKKINLGNFSFKTILGDQTLNCNFDPSLTKISTKTGEEILLDLEEGNYLILEK